MGVFKSKAVVFERFHKRQTICIGILNPGRFPHSWDVILHRNCVLRSLQRFPIPTKDEGKFKRLALNKVILWGPQSNEMAFQYSEHGQCYHKGRLRDPREQMKESSLHDHLLLYTINLN